MRYLIVAGGRLALLSAAAVRKYDSKAHITLVTTSREVSDLARSLSVDQVVEGIDSLRERAELKLIDAAIVELESVDNYCELGRHLKRHGVPLLVALSTSAEGPADYRNCGYSFLIPVGRFIETAVGSIIGLDVWVDVPTHTFANINIKTYRVFRRARLGISLRDITNEVGGTRGLVALYDKEGHHVTSGDYLIAEGDLIAVAAPTDRDVVAVMERLNKLFMLAERVYTALESRRPPG